MTRWKFALVAIVAAIAAVATPATSQAGFKITLSQEGFGNTPALEKVINDGGSGDRFGGAAGVIGVLENFGSFSIVTNIATSNSEAGSSPAILTINSLTINALSWWGGGQRTLTITIEDDGFTAPTGGVLMDSSLSGWALPNGTLTYQSFLEDQAGTKLTLNATPTSDSISGTDSATVGGSTYTLKSVLTITMGATAAAQGMGSTTVYEDPNAPPATAAAPAPASLILAATALPFLGFLRRMRRAELQPTTSA